jgi:membrane fusion protein (multidrug efflux system)
MSGDKESSNQEGQPKREDRSQQEGQSKQEDRSTQGGQSGQRPGSPHSRKSYKFLWIFGAVVLVLGIAVLIYHFMVGQYHVKTKDAYVNGNLIRLAPQVSGTVTRITTDQTQPVRRGQLLVQLDPHDTEVSLAQARANLAQTVRDVAQLFAEERRDEAAVSAQEAQLTLANQNLGRDQALIKAHGVSQEDLERDQENARNAEAGVRQARAALAATQAAVQGTQPETHPRVKQAEANLRSAWLAHNRTQVLAPVSGYVVRRSVQLGQQVNPATEMLALVPLNSVWIDANYKETELEKIRIGQPVEVKADVYGSHFTYHGKVLGLTAGTGAALAVLPPENATGNWIKIVQRLPVRIGLDPNELRDHPLFLGLSTSVNIDVHDQTGASLSHQAVWPAEMQTDVYASQDAGVDTAINQILQDNLGRPAVAATGAPNGTSHEAPNGTPNDALRGAPNGAPSRAGTRTTAATSAHLATAPAGGPQADIHAAAPEQSLATGTQP